MATQDWTDKFNTARQEHGLDPVRGKTITLIHEGMRAGCGCEVISVTGTDFTVRHRVETCSHRFRADERHKTEVREHVGDGMHNAIGSLFEQPDVIPMTQPWCGLFPYEQQARAETDAQAQGG